MVDIFWTFLDFQINHYSSKFHRIIYVSTAWNIRGIFSSKREGKALSVWKACGRAGAKSKIAQKMDPVFHTLIMKEASPELYIFPTQFALNIFQIIIELKVYYSTYSQIFVRHVVFFWSGISRNYFLSLSVSGKRGYRCVFVFLE